MGSSVRSGFTLIELSIVLVIIGLIAGGILTGKTLIEAARVRKAVSTHNEFLASWNTFKLKYNCIAGDCANATSFWSVDNSCATLPGPASTTGTCIGNGDKKVAWAATVTGSVAEAAIVFNHLKHAGLWQHGLPNDEFPYYTPPKWNRGTDATFTVGSSNSYAQMYGGNAPNAINAIGNGVHSSVRQNFGGFGPSAALETASFTQSIDQKIDDGQPQTGKFRASNGTLLGTNTWLDCIISDGGSGWIYNITNTDITCRFMLLLD